MEFHVGDVVLRSSYPILDDFRKFLAILASRTGEPVKITRIRCGNVGRRQLIKVYVRYFRAYKERQPESVTKLKMTLLIEIQL